MYAIELDKVTKIYRKGFRGVKVPAVTDLSFAVQRDKITGFVGPNGAGKTTTIKMVTGLVFPTRGTIILNGKKGVAPVNRSGIAYLSEQPYFYAHLKVGEMLDFVARLIRLPHGNIQGDIKRVLDLVELSHKQHTKVKELSKGMQQRLNMAQALLGNPHTLILDEPMSGMDPPGRRLFREILLDLKKQGKTLFFSTHVLDDIESVCDDVVVVQQGKLTYAGSVSALLDEGFTGTEIALKNLTADAKKAIDQFPQVTLHEDLSGGATVTVDRQGNPQEVLARLAAVSVFPDRVQKKTMTLENLLYHRSTGGAL